MDVVEKIVNYVVINGGQRKLVLDKLLCQVWLMEDIKVIKRKFFEFFVVLEIGLLIKLVIEVYWQKDDVFRVIYEREEMFLGRIYIKVKIIFRWNFLV